MEGTNGGIGQSLHFWEIEMVNTSKRIRPAMTAFMIFVAKNVSEVIRFSSLLYIDSKRS